MRHREALCALLTARLGEQKASWWVEQCAAASVPAGLVNSIAEAFEFADTLGLEAVTELRDTDSGRASRQVSNPIHLARTPPRHRALPPQLDQHNGAQWHEARTDKGTL